MSVKIVRKSAGAPIVNRIGLPTAIIAAFFLVVMMAAAMLGLPLPVLMGDVLRRFGMNGVLVLAMVPSIKSGKGPNFALPLGIICGLLGWTLGIEMGFTGMALILVVAAIATVLAIITGYLYGILLNAVKGAEMTIATYTGFSVVALMSLVWLMAPFKSKQMGWMMGSGLRETIKLDGVVLILLSMTSFALSYLVLMSPQVCYWYSLSFAFLSGYFSGPKPASPSLLPAATLSLPRLQVSISTRRGSLLT